MVFDVAEKGFVPVPIILRKLIRHLSAPELRVLVYLQLRASRYGICYPTYDEIVHELGLMGRKNLFYLGAAGEEPLPGHRDPPASQVKDFLSDLRSPGGNRTPDGRW